MLHEWAERLEMAPEVLLALLAAAVAAVALPLLSLLLRRRRRSALVARLAPEAARRGMRFHPPGSPPPEVESGPPSAAWSLAFSGSARGLTWRADVEEDPFELRRMRRVCHLRTRLTFPAAALPPGRFALVMGLPAGQRSWEATPPQGEGLLAGMGRRVLESAADLYAATHFGARHRALVTIAGAQVIPGPEGFWVLANDPEAAGRLLSGEAPRLLEAARRGNQGGPFRGEPLDDLGLLLSPEGLTVGCLRAVREPARLQALVEWSAQLAEQARPG